MNCNHFADCYFVRQGEPGNPVVSSDSEDDAIKTRHARIMMANLSVDVTQDSSETDSTAQV